MAFDSPRGKWSGSWYHGPTSWENKVCWRWSGVQETGDWISRCLIIASTLFFGTIGTSKPCIDNPVKDLTYWDGLLWCLTNTFSIPWQNCKLSFNWPSSKSSWQVFSHNRDFTRLHGQRDDVWSQEIDGFFWRPFRWRNGSWRIVISGCRLVGN